MTVNVTSDLVDISTCDALTSGGTWYRLSGTSSANPAADLDAFVQGSGCISNKMGTTVSADVGGHFNHTTTFDLSGGKMLFYWRQVLTPGNMLTKANQGITIGLTTANITSTTAWSTTNYKKWFMDGSDTMPTALGWIPYCLDPNQAADLSAGTLALNSLKNIGFICRQNSTVTSTVSNQFVDAVRAGTGLTLTCSSGADIATLTDAFNVDNNQTNRWGIITQQAGIFYGQGAFNVGSSGQANACNLEDSNQVFVWRKNIIANDGNKFNLISNSPTNSTKFTLSSFVIRGQQGAKWVVTCDANSAFKLYSCSVSDAFSMTLSAQSVIDGATVSNCGNINLKAGSVINSSFSGCTATAQILCEQPSGVQNISNTSFVKGPQASHAIEIRGSVSNVTLNKVNFSGYSATNGSTGSEAIFVNIASGTITITVSGGNTPSIRTAGATVNVVSGATVTFAGFPAGCDIVILTTGTNTVLQQVDQHSTTSYSWGYQGTPTIDVGFIKPGYIPFYIRNLALGSADSSIPVSMTPDRNYA